ncbi:MAG: hypothetical protein AVDCRST_MAG38-2255 [uncultured Solirubrobacteraceae bacterium]|uniref:Uncharacterized protein n=1 Tax=uncultured Solirubrobacteraceae bacterium TaxID=1162706 RepID=A0A6J4RY05_9ACTN|nr:MAG: hypothetical protein AVDCRST_MAG38-2255 [uncultured Solirubrobacteraceae bacterium]
MNAAGEAWRRLSPGHRHAAVAAAGLILALALPFYEKQAFELTDDGRLVSARENLSAFGVISFVEGAVMLVAAAVLALIVARAREAAFTPPGGDGSVIAAAGAWALALLIWRLFDKPDVTGRAVTVGIQWGWFVAVVIAAALLASGWRLREAGSGPAPGAGADRGPHSSE